MIKEIKEVYKYRELLKANVKKEIRGKYKESFLGLLWSFVNPLLSVLVYAIVFPLILKDSQPHYVTYLVIGIIPWTFFTTAISQGTTSILVNSGIIKKVYFPREILPISVVSSALINFLISCLIIIIFVICSGIGLSLNLLYLPLIAIIQYFFTLGLVLITSSINVYIRDAEYIINFIVAMLFYATPILYSSTLFPPNLRWIHKFNPLATLINSYRDIFYYKVAPNIGSLLILLLVSLLLTVIGYKIFNKLEKGFAEEV